MNNMATFSLISVLAPLISKRGAQVGVLQVSVTITDTDVHAHAALAVDAGRSLSGPTTLQKSLSTSGTLGSAIIEGSERGEILLDVLLDRLKDLDGIVRVLDVVAEVSSGVVP